MISHGVLLAGATLGPLLAHSEHRLTLLGLIDGKDLPIPGYPGASVRVGRQGGGATLPVPGFRPVVGRGSIEQAPSGRMNWQVTITIDAASLLRSAGVEW